MVLQDTGPESLFNYMTKEFQDALLDLLTTRTANDFLPKYLKFVQTFGYGCVTELYLTSGSAFKMSVTYEDDAAANHSKYGLSLGVGAAFGGASVASGYAKNALKAGSTRSIDMVAEQLPATTPTRVWCEQLMNAVLGAGLDKLAQHSELIKPYAGEAPKAPDIPDGTPDKKKLPDSETPAVTEELKKELMKQDNFRGTWDAYLKAQQEAYQKLNPEIVTAEVCENRERLLSMPIDMRETDVISQPPQIDPIGDSWPLGGYIPYDYKVTPWTELFPQLKTMALPTTFTSIYIAKAYVYYLTRLQFASYLYFLADVGPKICENSNIKYDANNYAEACNQLLKDISNTMTKNNGTFHLNDYEKIVAMFEQRINKMPYFYSGLTYWCFFMNYRFFIENACGFILVKLTRAGNYYYGATYPTLPLPEPFSVIGMLEEGLRFYQVLTPQARLNSIVFMDKKFKKVLGIENELSAKRKTDSKGFPYYEAQPQSQETNNEMRFYGAGFPELRSMKNTSIVGRPMITDFDFDSVIQFANPNEPL